MNRIVCFLKKISLFTLIFTFLTLLPFQPDWMRDPSPAEIEEMLKYQSPQEVEEFLKLRGEMTNHVLGWIDEQTQNLSEDEKKKFIDDFDQEVQKLQKELVEAVQTEGDEGAMKFFQRHMGEEQEIPKEPVAAEPKKEEAVKQTKVTPARDINEALKLINDLIYHIERFLRTSKMIPELPGNIEKWISKNKIKEWKANLTWEMLKPRIEELVQQLHSLKELDPKTKKNRHAEDLLKNEALYNNLSHILAKLTTHEPKVEAPAFGLGKVSSQSRAAIQEVLSVLAEALYTLNVIDEIQKIKHEYEPRAKTLREEEEAQKKRALEESKRTRTEAPRKETVRLAEYGQADTSAGGGYAGGNGGGYYPQDYYPSYDDSYYPSQSYEQTPQSARSGGQRGQPSKMMPGEQQGGEKKGSEKQQPGSKPKEGEKKGEETKDTTGDSLKKLDKDCKRIVAIMTKGPGKLTTIDAAIAPGQAVNAHIISDIFELQSKLKSATDTLKKIKLSSNKLRGEKKDELKEDVRDTIAPAYTLMTNLASSLETIQTRANLSADQTYAYFDGRNQNQANQAITKQIAKPASLEALGNDVKNFMKECQPYAPAIQLPEEAKEQKAKAAAAQDRAVASEAELKERAPEQVQPAQGQAQQQAKRGAQQAQPGVQAPAAGSLQPAPLAAPAPAAYTTHPVLRDIVDSFQRGIASAQDEQEIQNRYNQAVQIIEVAEGATQDQQAAAIQRLQVIINELP